MAMTRELYFTWLRHGIFYMALTQKFLHGLDTEILAWLGHRYSNMALTQRLAETETLKSGSLKSPLRQEIPRRNKESKLLLLLLDPYIFCDEKTKETLLHSCRASQGTPKTATLTLDLDARDIGFEWIELFLREKEYCKSISIFRAPIM